MSWVDWVEQFFRYYGIPLVDKVILSSFHLEDNAQLWYQLPWQEDWNTWEELGQGLHVQFGPSQLFDPFGELRWIHSN